MTSRRQVWLVFNGVLVVIGACLVGFPYAEAVKKARGVPQWFSVPGTEAQWNLAHTEGLINGLLVLALVSCVARIRMSDRLGNVVFWGLVATAWGNFGGALVAALGSDEILGFGVGDENLPALVLFAAAAAGAFLALGGIIVACVRTFRRDRRATSVVPDSQSNIRP